MFTVIGTINSVPYRVGVHNEDMGENHGVVMGSDNATSLLRLLEGDYVQQTPTHEEVRLSLMDPASVLAALHEHTNVVAVTGDVPADVEPVISGTIY
jgi:hypothetical protein